MSQTQEIEVQLAEVRTSLLRRLIGFLAACLSVIVAIQFVLTFSGYPITVLATTASSVTLLWYLYFSRALTTGQKALAVVITNLVTATLSLAFFADPMRAIVIAFLTIIVAAVVAPRVLAYATVALVIIHNLIISLGLTMLMENDLFKNSAPLTLPLYIFYGLLGTLVIYLINDLITHRLLPSFIAQNISLRHDERSGALSLNALKSDFERINAEGGTGKFRFFRLDLLLYDIDRAEQLGVSESDLLRNICEILRQGVTDQLLIGANLDWRSGLILIAHEQAIDGTCEFLRQINDNAQLMQHNQLALSVRCTCSDFPADGDSFELQLSNLELAMRRADLEHLEMTCFTPIDRIQPERQQMHYLSDAASAFEHRQFELYLQPKISATETGRILGAETLIRWNHPREGLLAPHAFLDTLLNSHVRTRLSSFVIHESARLLASSLAVDPAQRVALNLNAYDLTELQTLSELQRAKDRYDLPDGSLIIEISEAQTSIDTDRLSRAIAALKAMGFSIALDDFGQEMSSLSYVVSLPLDQIKIDKVFLDSGLDRAATDQVIRFVADLAKSKGWSTVVEGVETAEQANRVARLGVDELQGYLFGKPMTEAEFLARLKQQQAEAFSQSPSYTNPVGNHIELLT